MAPTVPLHVAHVRSNVKGGVDLALGPKTLIVGPSGAGKSRVLNSIELALSGYASDIVGRPAMKQGSELIALAPADEPLESSVTLSDGSSASFRIERKAGGRTGRPAHAAAAGEEGLVRVQYPAPYVVKTLRGNVKTARTFVLEQSGIDLTHAAIGDRLPSEVREWWDGYGAGQDQALSSLIAAEAVAQASLKESRANLKAGLEALKGQGSAMSISVDPAAIEAAQLAVRTANEAYIEARKLPEPVDLSALLAEAKAALEGLQRQEEKVAKIAIIAQVETETTRESIEARSALSTLLSLVANYTKEPTQMECVLCGSTAHVDPADYQSRADILAQNNTTAQSVLFAQSTLPQEQATLAQWHETAERRVHAYRAAKAAQEAAEAVDRSEAVQTAYGALVASETALRELVESKGRWESLEHARSRVEVAEVEVRAWEARKREVERLTSELVTEAREAFVARVQAFLPDTDTFDLVLRVGNRDVCMFGFRRGGELHTALSGAEWARLTCALGAVCVPSEGTVLAVIAPEERAYDGVTLASMMRGLSGAPGQVILTSPVKPRGRTPKGWTIIEAGGET
jgi:hypothetical protein